MIRRPPRSTRTATLFPNTARFRALYTFAHPSTGQHRGGGTAQHPHGPAHGGRQHRTAAPPLLRRSEEHTSELQSLMRISYAVFCLKKKQHNNYTTQQMTKQKTLNTTTTILPSTYQTQKLLPT